MPANINSIVSFMPGGRGGGGRPAKIRGGHANFRTVREGVMRKLAYKRGGGAV